MNKLDRIEILTALELVYLICAINIHLVLSKHGNSGALIKREYLVCALCLHRNSVTVKLYGSIISNSLFFL